jgi:hypothetical protein
VGSGGGGGAEKRNTTHAHASVSIHQTRGRRPEFRWVLWLSPVLCTCTEGHRRGRWGWTVGCCKDETGCNMHRLRSADLCIDRQDSRKDKDDDDDSNVAQRYCIAVDVIWCKWRFTCNFEDSRRGKSCASKHASPTLATLLGPRYVHKSKVEASGWQRHRTVAPRCNFPVINNHTFHSVYGYITSDYPFRSIHHGSIIKLL